MISIAIPVYEMHGRGVEVLEYSFRKLQSQTYKDFEVAISDDSRDFEILKLCEDWKSKLNIKYFRNERRGAATNTENSIRKSSGELIRLLCQDDYFYDETVLERIVSEFTEDINWLASGYVHTYDRVELFRYHLPRMNPRIYCINTLGTPSCITLRNVPIPEFDPTLTYAYDCDFYKKFYDLYGEPKIVDFTSMVNYLWEGSITFSTSQPQIERELEYVRRKYEEQ